MKLLHIIATPRNADSRTLNVSDAFVQGLRAARGDLSVDVVDLFDHDLPAIAGDNIEAKYTLMYGQPIDKAHEASWRQIESLIAHFLAADAYLISTPMWNFTVPYALKYYIDCIVQPGYLFRYNEMGQVLPLVNGKRMVCVTSHGADYSPGGPLGAYNFLQPYMRSIFGFVGVTDIEFITAQPMDITPALREQAIGAAIDRATALAVSPAWSSSGQPDSSLSPV